MIGAIACRRRNTGNCAYHGNVVSKFTANCKNQPKMKKYLIIIIMSLSFTSFGQNCAMLKNGKYEIQYDTKDRNSSLFEIDGNTWYSPALQQCCTTDCCLQFPQPPRRIGHPQEGHLVQGTPARASHPR